MNKIIFKNKPDLSTPISAENLNLLQDNVENAINGEILYTSSGEKGTITLNKSCANFKRIKLIGFGKRSTNDNTYFCKEVDNPNGKNSNIDFTTYNGSTYSYSLNEIINFSEDTIIRGSQWKIGIGQGVTRNEGEIYITEVIGYK